MIYLLRQRDENVCWDEYRGKVIRAESEQEARRIANKNTGDEGEIWEDERCTSCVLITPEGPSSVILEDFKAG